MLILLSLDYDSSAALTSSPLHQAAMVSSISNIYIGIGNTQIQNIGIIQEIWRRILPPWPAEDTPPTL